MCFIAFRVLRALPRSLVIVGAAGVLGLAGCQALTDVNAPDVVQPEDYTTAAGATALAAGAITQFHTIFGSIDNLVQFSGALADELAVTSSIGSGWEWDSRNSQDPSTSTEPYTQLQETRQRLLYAIATFQRVVPDSSARIGQLFALLGYTSVFFGENFCAGVPLSHRTADLRPVYGQPLTTAQLFDSALVAFDSALIHGGDGARIAHLAQVGRGRALLNLGRLAEAAQAVAGVPTEYLYHVTFVPGAMVPNGFAFVGPDGSPQDALTVPAQEGGNGLDWRTAGDPRVRLVNRSPAVLGEDGETEVWAFVPYEANDAPMPLASGIEARLIEAEAALQAGDAGTWIAIHNELRATAPGLDPLTDPGTAAGRVDLHFRERAFWLFLTGHRLGDLRRLMRQYGRGAESVFPTGEWKNGVLYGTAADMAPPATQTNNPQYTGCLDREV